MRTLEQIPIQDVLTVERVAQQSYDELWQSTQQTAREIDLSPGLTYSTLSLLEDLREHHEDTALGALRAMPIAMDIAEERVKLFKKPIDLRWTFMAALLHDIGKFDQPVELLEKSALGKEWTPSNVRAMQPHAERGGLILRANGFPRIVWRPVAGSHSRQLWSDEYGLYIPFDDEARLPRDNVCIADSVEASETRPNTRNRGMTTDERRQKEALNIAYVLDEDPNRQVLIPRVIGRVLGEHALYGYMDQAA